MDICPLCGNPKSNHKPGCQAAASKTDELGAAGGPLFGAAQSGPRRTRTVLLRLLIPLVCLLGLLAALGVIYRKSFQGVEEIVLYPASNVKLAPGAPDFESLKPQYMKGVNSGAARLDRFSGDKYRGSLEALESEAKVFLAWATLINEMDHYPLDEAEIEAVRSVARKLEAIQVREFPLMRQEWAKGLMRALRKYRVSASCAGRHSEVVRVTLPPGASEEAVDECMGYLTGELPAQLRVAHVDFTFTLGPSLTAPVKPKNPAPPDSAIVIWRGLSYDLVDWKE